MYKIEVLNNCMLNSDLSPYHRTINLMLSMYNNNVGLLWSHYIDEGMDLIPDKYYIFKGTQADNLVLYDSVSASVTNYNDNNVTSLYYYKIGIKLPSNCTSVKGINLYSFSNITDNFYIVSIDSTINQSVFRVSPNPCNDILYIFAPNDFKEAWDVELYDIFGRLVLALPKSDLKSRIIDTSMLSSGIYYITVSNYFRSKIVME